MTEQELKELHEHCHNNKVSIKKSKMVGCFYCLEIYPKEDIQEWTPRSGNAICPKCGVDSVLGQIHFDSVKELKKVLPQMYDVWFKVAVRLIHE